MIKPGEYLKIDKTSIGCIDELSLSFKKIYRYLPLEYLMDMLYYNNNVFVNPVKWNDPFDNYLFKYSIGKSSSFTKNIFCQCLTLNPHSQAYWKTYGGNGFAARVTLDSKKYLTKLNTKTPH